MNVILLVILTFVALGLGIAFLIFGYRFFLVLLPIWGFIAGLWLGAEVVSVLLDEAFLASVTGLVVGLVAGIILAILAYLFYAVGVLLVGASFGFWLGTGVMYGLGFEPSFIATLVAAVVAIIFAALTVLLDVKKHLVIVITALGGSGAILLAILLAFSRFSVTDFQSGAYVTFAAVLDDSFWWSILWLLLGIAGIIIQEVTTRGYLIEYDRQYGT